MGPEKGSFHTEFYDNFRKRLKIESFLKQQSNHMFWAHYIGCNITIDP